MGILSWLGFGTGSPTVGVQSPYAPTDNLVTFAAEEVLGEMAKSGAVTREIALSVPGVKRAHGIHCATVAGLSFYENDADVRVTEQPAWLTSGASGMSPYQRMYGVTSDLFMNGWACLGFNADMTDAIHIPYGYWNIDRETGEVIADERISPIYRARLVAIPLGYGSNGILIDGRASIRAAIAIERAWIDRVENPVPQTDLHFTDPKYDDMSKRNKLKIVSQWNEQRRQSGGQTAVTQSFVEVRALGVVSADLFEKGRNAVRLDLANHSAVPASIIEGSKDSGGSDIEYSNGETTPNELYAYGTKNFVQAIEARLSLDDVCAPGRSIRADLAGVADISTPRNNPTSED